MIIYTIGFTKKAAKEFFGLISENHIEILLDVRLNNSSQLAGFSKANDLEYFLKALCKCEYRHCEEYAPTADIMHDFKKKRISWEEYDRQYTKLMNDRNVYPKFWNEFSQYNNICLLCSEATPQYCHRRLLAERLQTMKPDDKSVIHL